MSPKTDFQSIDEYIAACPEQSQERLQQIRAVVKKLAPKATERISYQIAAFELNGKNIIHFAGWKKHISLYPVPAGSEAFERQIKPYVSDKGTVKFPLDEPLPLKLIEKIVKQHLAVNEKQKKEN